MLYLIGIIITFFLLLVLLGKKDRQISDKILSIWLLIIGIHLLIYYIHISKLYFQFPYFLGFDLILPLLHGPFLYLYVVSLTQKSNLSTLSCFHFIPFTIATLSLYDFFSLSIIQKIKVYQNEGIDYEIHTTILLFCIIISGILYTVISFLKLRQHQKMIGEEYSNLEKINFKWLTYLIIGSSIIWISVLVGTDELTFAVIVFYVLFIGYFGINQVGIFTNLSYPDNLIVIEKPIENMKETEKLKYEKNSITNENLTQIHNSLNEIMDREKLFKNPELTISEVAQQLDVHPNILSQVINTVEQNNFYEYINKLRIEEFKKLISLPDYKNLTLLAIAFDCGFNSKTTFNRSFKKITSMSPSDYLKQLNLEKIQH